MEQQTFQKKFPTFSYHLRSIKEHLDKLYGLLKKNQAKASLNDLSFNNDNVSDICKEIYGWSYELLKSTLRDILNQILQIQHNIYEKVQGKLTKEIDFNTWSKQQIRDKALQSAQELLLKDINEQFQSFLLSFSQISTESLMQLKNQNIFNINESFQSDQNDLSAFLNTERLLYSHTNRSHEQIISKPESNQQQFQADFIKQQTKAFTSSKNQQERCLGQNQKMKPNSFSQYSTQIERTPNTIQERLPSYQVNNHQMEIIQTPSQSIAFNNQSTNPIKREGSFVHNSFEETKNGAVNHSALTMNSNDKNYKYIRENFELQSNYSLNSQSSSIQKSMQSSYTEMNSVPSARSQNKHNGIDLIVENELKQFSNSLQTDKTIIVKFGFLEKEFIFRFLLQYSESLRIYCSRKTINEQKKGLVWKCLQGQFLITQHCYDDLKQSSIELLIDKMEDKNIRPSEFKYQE